MALAIRKATHLAVLLAPESGLGLEQVSVEALVKMKVAASD